MEVEELINYFDRVIKNGDHFFQEDVSELIGHLDEYLDKALPKAA